MQKVHEAWKWSFKTDDLLATFWIMMILVGYPLGSLISRLEKLPNQWIILKTQLTSYTFAVVSVGQNPLRSQWQLGWRCMTIFGHLPVLCHSSHCSCLTGSSRDVWGGKGVWTGSIQNQKLTISPWNEARKYLCNYWVTNNLFGHYYLLPKIAIFF